MDKKRSNIWHHFKEISGNNTNVICNYCSNGLSIKGGSTTNLSRHLRVKHPDVFKIQQKPSPSRKYKKQKVDDNLELFMKTCTNAVNNSNEKPDEYDALGINYAAKIRKMKPDQQIYAELLFQKVITTGLLGQLHADTDLVDTSLKATRNDPVCSDNRIELVVSDVKSEVL